jgi:hypothetical protein
MAGYQRGGPNNETDIDDSITDDSTANLTKAVIAGEDSNGTYNNVGAENGRLNVASVDLTAENILSLILKELCIIRLHQEKASNEKFTESDID